MRLSSSDFDEEVLKSDIPVLVDFFADWCGPCKMMAPIVEQLATQYTGKLKVGQVNVDDNPDLAGKYGVMSIPTFIIFKNGEIVGTSIGSVSKNTLIEKIQKAIE